MVRVSPTSTPTWDQTGEALARSKHLNHYPVVAAYFLQSSEQATPHYSILFIFTQYTYSILFYSIYLFIYHTQTLTKSIPGVCFSKRWRHVDVLAFERYTFKRQCLAGFEKYGRRWRDVNFTSTFCFERFPLRTLLYRFEPGGVLISWIREQSLHLN